MRLRAHQAAFELLFSKGSTGPHLFVDESAILCIAARSLEDFGLVRVLLTVLSHRHMAGLVGVHGSEIDVMLANKDVAYGVGDFWIHHDKIIIDDAVLLGEFLRWYPRFFESDEIVVNVARLYLDRRDLPDAFGRRIVLVFDRIGCAGQKASCHYRALISEHGMKMATTLGRATRQRITPQT